MKSYKDLIVWKKSVQLSVDVYKMSHDLPKNELYALTSQIQRCAVSIPSNIAEGQRRESKKEFLRFLRVAYGSGAELETQLLIASKIGYLTKSKYIKLNEDLEQVLKMLNRLISVLGKTANYKLKTNN